MTYDETIEYLYNSAPMFQNTGSSAYKEGMENSFLIDKRLNHPHTKYRTIHVGGTNGKGSTSHLLASILQEAGYKTGLYTSPHLLDFRERIRINGEMISKEFVVDFVAANKDFFETLQPSFFELTTGMAFAYFAEEKVDVAIIEVGLGGRLDCTNVITPVLSIITNISLDHTNLLGNTPTAIAREKAGIIKSGVPVVIGEAEGEVKDVFIEKRKTEGDGQIVFAQTIEGEIFNNDGADYWKFNTPDYPELIGELGGYAQEKNAATVLCALEILKKEFSIPSQTVYGGFGKVIENTGLQGRWQIVQHSPKVVLDTGHNIGGITYIVKQLLSAHYEKLHIVFGMVNDKDISSVLKILPQKAIYYFTQANIPRALDARLLAEQAATFGLKGDFFHSVEEAFLAAKDNAMEKDFIYVGGSTFIVADALLLLKKGI